MAIIYFDLETASFEDREILQIAANCGGRTFHCYVQPQSRNPKMATNIHGFSYRRGVLKQYGQAVTTVSLRRALNMFLDYLTSFEEPCFLVAHNVTFDAHVLLKAIIFCNLIDEYRSCISGFVDTVPILKKLVSKVQNYKLSTLAEHFRINTSGMHDAMNDVRVLEDVFEMAGGKADDLRKCSKSFDCYSERRRVIDKKSYIQSLEPLVSFGVLSKPMIIQAAEAGISMGHILLALDNHGEEGLIKLFAQFLVGAVCEDAAYSVATFVNKEYLCDRCKASQLKLAEPYGHH